MIVLRYLLLGLGLCVLATLGWRLARVPTPTETAVIAPAPLPQGPPEPPAPPSSTPSSSAATQLDAAREVVLNRMADVPPFKVFYDRLADARPHVHDAIVEAAARRLADAGVLGSSDALLWDALRMLQQSQGIMAARAGPDVLTAFFDARLALLDALSQVDAKLCADFLYGTADSTIDAFSASHRDLIAALATAELAAITDGQTRPSDTTKPTSADIDLVAAGLAARALTPDEIAVLIDGKSADPPIPDARLCEMGRQYLSVLRGLPAEARQRVYGFAAELLARS